MLATQLGDRRPNVGRPLAPRARDARRARVIWWTATSAVEEYEDALFTAFAEGVADDERAALPDPDVDPAVRQPAPPDR